MSQDLSDFVYLEAKEKAFEIEIETRKIFESKKENIVNEGRVKLDDDFARRQANKETEYRMYIISLTNIF